MLLRATNISKSYGGVQALKAASFELRSGEVHALIGENGAGKSTLIKIITGAVEPSGGVLEVNGQAINSNSPSIAKALGIAAIYQQPALFPELSVAENIALGIEKTGLWGRVNWRKRRQRAAELLATIGANIDPDADAGDLTMPQQQLTEIARALGANAKVLIFDEPTASLGEADTNNLFRVIRQLRAEGVGIVYISHRLEELPEIADRVTVLRDGTTIGTRAMAGVSRQELIQLMVGRELEAVFPKREVPLGEDVLEVRGLCSHSRGVRDVSFTVRAGEILGVAGLVGAGRTYLARALFGIEPADAGQVLLRGQPLTLQEPAQAIAQGIAFVPEDRRRHGVVLEMAVSSNVTLASLDKLTTFGALDTSRERELAAAYTQRLGIKTPTIAAPVGTLSGGNQQKVALSRWLETKPSVLILDEPTQGIDVGAKSEIHALMGELAAQGVAIVMISSELPEVLGMSDRVAVMHDGRISGMLDRAEATQEKVLSLALGHSAH